MTSIKKKAFDRCVAIVLSLAMLLVFPIVSFADVFAGTADAANNTQTVQTDDSAAAESGNTGSDQDQETQATDPTDSDKTADEGNSDSSASDKDSSGSDNDSSVVKYPRQTFEDSVNGTKINVTAPEGALPEGTTMEVKAVASSDVKDAVEKAANREIKDMQAIDISFHKDGNEIEPQSKVTVQFSGMDMDGDSIQVFHMSDKASSADKVAESKSMTNASVEADQFSIYVLAGLGDNGKVRATYNFYDGDKLVDTQIVKDGETLVEPSVPAGSADKQFAGWATKADSNDYQIFGAISIPDTATEDYTVDLYAQYGIKQYVRFHSSSLDSSIILQTKSGVAGDTIKTNDVSVTTLSGQALTGWSTTKDGTEAVGDTVILGDKDIDLYPIISDVNWVTFDSDGGTYVDPEYALPGKTVAEPTAPKKAGYTFKGWYTSDGDAYDFSSAVNGETTLYAKWAPTQVKYTIVYWQEALQKDGSYVAGNYAYKDTETAKAEAGSKIALDENVLPDYTYYHLAKVDPGVVVKGDGSTIVNVYYDLNKYTLNFDLDGYYEGSFGYHDVTGAELTVGGKQYTGDSYSITARMGEDISSQWPISVTDGSYKIVKLGKTYTAPFFSWVHSGDRIHYVSKRFNLTSEMLDSTDSTKTTDYTAYYKDGDKVTLHYMLEKADGTGYEDSAKYGQTALTDGGFSAKEIDGFTHIDREDSYQNGNYYFYYTRNSYDLSFYNYNTTDKTKSVKYEASISGYNYTPDRPAGLSEEYSFAGWYTTEDCKEGTQFDFTDAQMPAHGLMLYAKWAKGKVTVTFDSNGGSDVDGSPFTIESGKTITKPTDPTRKGYTFAGWMNGNDPFNFSTEIHQNTTLTAKWLSNSKLTVKYDAGTGKLAPSDSNGYADGSNAKVLGSPTAPAGQYFQGWVLNGKTYYPGDTFTIDSSLANDNVITLTAKYGPKVADTSLVYHSNYTGSTAELMTGPYKNNSSVALKNADAFTRTGYHIVSWNTQANGQGTSYALGQTIGIDNLSSNDLYAVWAANEDVSYTVKYLEKGTDKKLADEKTVEGKTFNSTVKEDAIDITGYEVSGDATKSLTLSKYDGNEINFYYTAKQDVKYTVNYYLKGTTTKVADSKTVDKQTFNSTVKEDAIDITGYEVSGDATKSLTLSKYDGNEINFYYTAKQDVKYTVNYYLKGTTTKVADSKTVDKQTFNSTVKEDAIDITGYEVSGDATKSLTLSKYDGNEINFYYTAKQDVKYIVNYYLKGTTTKVADSKTVDKQTFNSTVKEDAIDITGYEVSGDATKSLTLSKYDGNEINFYYTAKQDVKYTVNYYLKGTTTKVADSKTVDKQTFNSTVKEDAIDITGYEVSGDATKSLTLSKYDGNEINFYYTAKQDVKYIVNYYLKGTTTKVADSKTVDKQTFNSTVKEDAIDITGYEVSGDATKSLTLSKYDGNEINFYYTAKQDVKYTVNYYLKGTTTKVADSKTVDKQTFNSTVKEDAIDITGYEVSGDATKSLTLSKYDGNEINFYYTAKQDVKYIVNYYLKGTTTKVADSKTVDKQTFNSTVKEDAIDITGYEVSGDATKSLTLSKYDGNEINFYYTAKQDVKYTVNYYLKGTTTKVADSKTVDKQTFNSTVKEDAIDITGYEVSGDATKSLTLSKYDGNEINFYYTAKQDVKYTVNYYLKGTTTKVADSKTVDKQTFNSTVKEDAIDITGYEVSGDATKSLTLSKYDGNEINFYYTAKQDVKYTVNYYLKGTTTKVADSKTVDKQTFNSTVKEDAIDITGYEVSGDATKSLTLSKYDGNEINFYYTAKQDVKYIVNYYLKGTTTKVADSKTVDKQTFNSTVKEDAIDITGYEVSGDATKSLTLSKYDGNEINFYYTAKQDVKYTVNYYLKGTTTKVADSKTVDKQTFNSTVKEDAIDITGYEVSGDATKSLTLSKYDGNEINFYYTAKQDVKYIVNYYLKGTTTKVADSKTVDKQTFNSTVKEDAIDITGYEVSGDATKSLTLSKYDGNEINFYYTAKQDVKYTVNYYLKGTTTKVADSKTVDKQTFNSTVKEDAIDITGYEVSGDATKSLTLSKYDGNEINFYYTAKQDVKYTVNYYLKGTTTKVADSKTVDKQTFNSTVKEDAIDITGYEVSGDATKSLTLSKYDGNEINFYYTAKQDVKYTVNYYLKGTTTKVADSKTVDKQTFNSTVKEDAIDITGYEVSGDATKSLTLSKYDGNEINFYYTAKQDVKYTVNYYLKGTTTKVADSKTVDKQTFNSTVKEDAIDITGYEVSGDATKSLTLSKYDGNEINFYYTAKQDVKYTVNYYLKGTTTKVADSKTVDKQTFNSTVKEDAIDITGYEVSGDATKSLTLSKYDGNEINFYYTVKQDVKYTVRYVDKDTNKEIIDSKLVENMTFGETYEETAPAITDYTVVAPDKQSITLDAYGKVITFFYTKNPTPPPASDKYTLTINYVDEQGNKLADSYTDSIESGTAYSQDSPVITDYKLKDSAQATVAGTMPKDNVTIDVVYTKTAVTPNDPNKPNNPKTPTTPTPASDKSADTSDSWNGGLWTLLLLLGAAGVAAPAALRRKDSEED